MGATKSGAIRLYGSIDTPTDGSSLVRAGDETVVICVWLSLRPRTRRGRTDQYTFEVNNTTNHLARYFNDYPKIAVFSDAYYATADPNKIFSGLGNTISAFERGTMLAGNSAPQFVTFFVPAPTSRPPQVTRSHMLAADLEGTRLPLSGTPGT